ncbi:MAG: tRNA-dihydrouridine synthase [Halobacteriovoraceae bacterium]|nr:tRNA-dihydrouridine synthase [Halobacteriovoraceae bacterium]
MPYSLRLQHKIDHAKQKHIPIRLGNIHFSSPLLLGPMSGICNAPFRLLMEELGAGGTVSELISCHGINHGNERTRGMLKIDPREQNIGLQIFGEDAKAMAQAAQAACDYGPRFIDINMGCPVKKVISKGAGAALLEKTDSLGRFFSTIKKAIPLPLTIKIRTGPKEGMLTAGEITHIAKEEGIEFIAIHGRTRVQKYKGTANWDYLEDLAQKTSLPLIGNGDLHSPVTVRERWKNTNCKALMLARGPLRHPFIFLEALDDSISFYPADYLEVIKKLYNLFQKYHTTEHRLVVQLRKHIVWMASGFPDSSSFRKKIFQTTDSSEVIKLSEDYFLSLKNQTKKLDYSQDFMRGGHG